MFELLSGGESAAPPVPSLRLAAKHERLRVACVVLRLPPAIGSSLGPAASFLCKSLRLGLAFEGFPHPFLSQEHEREASSYWYE